MALGFAHTTIGPPIGATGWPSQAGVNGAGYRADIVDIVEASRA
jgi:hypothetical protein